MSLKIEWKCPECGARPNKHGAGGREKCKSRRSGENCTGFICDCDDGFDDPSHGESYANQCHDAACDHCEWHGTFPVKPKGLSPWEKKAIEAGWSPPEKRAAELGLAPNGGKP